MPSRVLTFNQRPWQGGLNTAVDPALLSPDELTRAENIVFSTSGARKRRDGFGLWDHIATGVSRASSGTTRTIVLNINSGFSLNVDDVISVRHSSALDTEYDVKKASIASVDTVTYSPNVAITYEMSESLTEAATADSDIRIGRWESERVIGIYDYWYYSSGSKIQKIVGVTSDGNFYQYTTAGSKTAISTSGLTLSSPLSNCSFVTLGNKLIVAFDGEANKPVIWDGTSAITHISNTDWEGNDIQATNPTPSLEKLRVHQSRIFATVSGDPDRIHYCDVNNPQRWNGEGDSGALEVATGDGDSTGFSAIFPSFKGRLGVAKGNKLYQLIGEAPLQAVELISDGIGSQAMELAWQ